MGHVRTGPPGIGFARREYIKVSTSGGVVKLHIYMFTIDVESNGEVARVLNYQMRRQGVEPTNVDIIYGLYLVVLCQSCSFSVARSHSWKYE